LKEVGNLDVIYGLEGIKRFGGRFHGKFSWKYRNLGSEVKLIQALYYFRALKLSKLPKLFRSCLFRSISKKLKNFTTPPDCSLASINPQFSFHDHQILLSSSSINSNHTRPYSNCFLSTILSTANTKTSLELELHKNFFIHIFTFSHSQKLFFACLAVFNHFGFIMLFAILRNFLFLNSRFVVVASV
jgi:hypothetical protein